MTSTKALVTGSRGFAGGWLCQSLLERGYEVAGLDRPPTGERISSLDMLGIDSEVEDIQMDLLDSRGVVEVVDGYSPDLVFHLAAQTQVGEANLSPLPTLEVNVAGTWNLLEAVRLLDQGARTVVASSDKAYGSQEDLPYRESAPLLASYPYDASKAAADLIARSYWSTYGMPVAVTRFANLYGGGDLNFARLIPETISAVLSGRPPVLRSDGTPERDYLYVTDAADAYLAVADALGDGGGAAGEAFNAGSGRPWSVSKVVEMICEISGSEVEPVFLGTGTPDGEIDRQFLDSAKIADICGWRPQIELRDGLTATYEWYSAHPEAIAPRPID